LPKPLPPPSQSGRAGHPRTPEAWAADRGTAQLIDAARRRQSGEEAAPTMALLADELVDAATARHDPDERCG